MKTMRKCNDEIYQLAKDQALVKKLTNKRFRPYDLDLRTLNLEGINKKALIYISGVINEKIVHRRLSKIKYCYPSQISQQVVSDLVCLHCIY
jgi:hypothetical protein